MADPKLESGDLIDSHALDVLPHIRIAKTGYDTCVPT